jgi:TalC/MipB family fructose-6-phosphate aldolase
MLLLDTANIPEIQTCLAAFPISGVTTNPSILKLEGPVPFYPHLTQIRSLLSKNQTLHIQTIAADTDTILAEARSIRRTLGTDIHIKIPATEPGLRAIKTLVSEQVAVTATCIYTPLQALLSVAAGADYIAPYCNRMEQMGLDYRKLISDTAAFIHRTASKTKILAASFKNITQATDALAAGAHAITLQPSLLHTSLDFAPIHQAVADFSRDWQATQSTQKI